MTSYIYLSDIHANYEALKYLKNLPEFTDPSCEFRFGGDYIDGYDLQPKATINTIRFIKELCDSGKLKLLLEIMTNLSLIKLTIHTEPTGGI